MNFDASRSENASLDSVLCETLGDVDIGLRILAIFN